MLKLHFKIKLLFYKIWIKTQWNVNKKGLERFCQGGYRANLLKRVKITRSFQLFFFVTQNHTGVVSLFPSSLEGIFQPGIKPRVSALQVDSSQLSHREAQRMSEVGNPILLHRSSLTQESELGSPVVQVDSLPTELIKI